MESETDSSDVFQSKRGLLPKVLELLLHCSKKAHIISLIHLDLIK